MPIRRKYGNFPLAICDPADVRDVGLPREIQLCLDHASTTATDHDTLLTSLPQVLHAQE